MKTCALPLLLVSIIFSTSAKAQHIYRDYDASAALSKYQSFAWVTPDINDEEDALLKDAAIVKLVEKSIGEKLIEKTGLRQTAEAPELLIACYIFNKDRRRPLRLNYDESQLNIYTEIRQWQRDGNLIIDLIDRQSNRLVWRGVAVRTLFKRDKPEKQIKKAVDRLFKKYPSSQRGWQPDYGKQGLYKILFPVGVVALLLLLH